LAISVLLMGYATSVWQLFLLRFISGVFTGFVPMSQALISTQTPKETAGKVLGTLQTGSVTGTLMGPPLGGVIADMISYSAAFKAGSITLFLSALTVMLGVQEVQAKIISQRAQTYYFSEEGLQLRIVTSVVFIVMITSSLV